MAIGTPITTGTYPQSLLPGIIAWFGADYKDHPAFINDLFATKKSNRKYEEVVQLQGLGLASAKGEGSPTTFDGSGQGFTNRFYNQAYSTGYVITREAFDDNLYAEVAKAQTYFLSRSMRITKEVVGHNIYNRAFNASYTFGDGKSLCATDHVTANGSQSNKLSTGAALSEASIENLCIQIGNAVDERGLEINLMPKCLVVPNDLKFEATRILNSVLQNNTANNAVNAIKTMGIIPEVVASPYLTSTTAWFIRTDASDGLIHFERTPREIGRDKEFDTDNMKVKAYERYTFGVGDWRGVYGSAGA